MAEKALAIRYAEDLPAPFLVAKGRGALAERILALAESSGVTIARMPELTERLFVLEPGSFIPEECFQIVAELLSYVHTVHSNRGKNVE